MNVSTPALDDDGVDLVFNLRGRPATLAVQVKSRFASSKRLRERGGIRRWHSARDFPDAYPRSSRGMVIDNYLMFSAKGSETTCLRSLRE